MSTPAITDNSQPASNAPSPVHPLTLSPCHPLTPTPSSSPIRHSSFDISHSPLPPFPLYPGELTLLIGHPGTGKSLLSLDLAARAVYAAPQPPLPAHLRYPAADFSDAPQPGNVLILSAEDVNLDYHLATFGIPADSAPDRQHTSFQLETRIARRYRSIIREERDSPFLQFLNSQSLLELRLLILDPLPSFVGPITASPSTILAQLKPILNVAAACHFPVLGISHLPKYRKIRSAADLDNLPLGSIAYTAIARSILLLTPDDRPTIPSLNDYPDDSLPPNIHRVTPSPCHLVTSPRSRLLIPIKDNLAPISAAYAFSFHPRDPNQPPVPPAEPTPKLPEDPTFDDRYHHRRIKALHTLYQHQRTAHDYYQRTHLPPPPTVEWEPTPILSHPLLRNSHHQPEPSESETTREKRRLAAERSQELADLESSKLQLAIEFLQTILADTPLPTKTVYQQAHDLRLTERTLERARSRLHIRPYFSGKNWFLPQISPVVETQGRAPSPKPEAEQ